MGFWVGEGVESGAEIQYQSLTDKMQLGVNVASGNLLVENQDLHVAGRGINFDASRTWNSLRNANSNGEIFGNWMDSNDPELVPYVNSPEVAYIDPSGHWYRFEKSGAGYLDPVGLNATLCVAGSPKPCPEKLPSGMTYRLMYNQSNISYDFNSYGKLENVQDQYGNTITLSSGGTTNWSALTTDTEGRKFKSGIYEKYWIGSIKEEGGTGREVTYGYDKLEAERALLQTFKDADGSTTHYAYTGENLTQITTPRGEVIKLAYDGQKRIKEIVRVTNTEEGTGPTTAYTYYEAGSAPAPCASSEKATIVQDPDGYEGEAGHTTTYCSNVLGQVTKRINANGNETSMAYNAQGNMTSTTAASPGTGQSGDVESLDYDSTGQNLLCVIEGTSTPETTCPSSRSKEALVTSYGYKDENNPFSATQTQNPEGDYGFACYNDGSQKESKQKEIIGTECPKTSESSGPAGSLQNKNDQLSTEHELKFSYNEHGQITASTDADGHTTNYEYEEKGNLKKITPPASSGISPTTITVYADSRPHIITNGAGQIETITYDNDDRITKIEYTGTGTAKTISFEYDPDGNLVKREDPTGVTKYTVDPLNRVTKEELPGGLSNSYEYDAASNLIAFTDSGGTTKYKYNALSELESMLEPGESKETTFAYDNDGRLEKITYSSGAVENYKLEPTTGRPETITAEGVTGTTVPKLTYTYKEGEDNTSLIQSMSESTGNTTSYTYDPLNRLKEAKTAGTSPSLYKYILDGAGNRLKQLVNTAKSEEAGAETNYFPANTGNQAECRQTVSGPCTPANELSAYSYDGAGEETAITPKNDTSGASFAYNAASELSTITPSGSSALALSYGGTGQNDLTAIGSTTTLQNSRLGITREVNSTGTSYFARTPTGLLIDERTPSGHFNPLYDAQGNIIALVSSSGKVERTFHYGPFGENIKSEGTQTIPYSFGYKGGYRMPAGNTGKGNVTNSLLHYGERYYDPTTGRWTQQDPENQLSSTTQGDRYSFAGSDPINLSDPSGRDSTEEEVVEGVFTGFGCASPETGLGEAVCGAGVDTGEGEGHPLQPLEEGYNAVAEGIEETARLPE